MPERLPLPSTLIIARIFSRKVAGTWKEVRDEKRDGLIMNGSSCSRNGFSGRGRFFAPDAVAKTILG